MSTSPGFGWSSTLVTKRFSLRPKIKLNVVSPTIVKMADLKAHVVMQFTMILLGVTHEVVVAIIIV